MRVSPYKENVDNYSQDSASRNPNRQFFQRSIPQNQAQQMKNSQLQDGSNNGSQQKLQSNLKQQPFSQRKKIFSVDEDNQSVSSAQQKKASTFGQPANSHMNSMNGNNGTLPNRLSEASAIPPRSNSFSEQQIKKPASQSSQQQQQQESTGNRQSLDQPQPQYVLQNQYQDLLEAKQAAEETYKLEIDDTKRHYEFRLEESVKKQQELVLKMQQLQQNLINANTKGAEIEAQLLLAEEEIIRLQTKPAQPQAPQVSANFQYLQQQMQSTINSLQSEKISLEKIISDGKEYIEKIKGESSQKSQQITRLKESLIANQCKSEQNDRLNEGNSTQIITMRTEIDKLIACNLELQKNLEIERREREQQSAEFSKMIGQQRTMNYSPAIVDDDSKQRKINELEMRLQQLVLKNGELTAESKTKQACIESLQKKFSERGAAGSAPPNQLVPTQQQPIHQQQQQHYHPQPQYQPILQHPQSLPTTIITSSPVPQATTSTMVSHAPVAPAQSARPFGGLSQITEEVDEENYYLEMSRREKEPLRSSSSLAATGQEFQKPMANFNEIKRLRDEVSKQSEQISALSQENILLQAPKLPSSRSNPVIQTIQPQYPQEHKNFVQQYQYPTTNNIEHLNYAGSHIQQDRDQGTNSISPYRNADHKLLAPHSFTDFQQHQVTMPATSSATSAISTEPTIIRQTLPSQRSVPDLRPQVPSPISSFVISKPLDYGQQTPSQSFSQPTSQQAYSIPQHPIQSQIHTATQLQPSSSHQMPIQNGPVQYAPATGYSNPVSTSNALEAYGQQKAIQVQQQQQQSQIAQPKNQFSRLSSNSLSFGSLQDLISSSNAENSILNSDFNQPWNSTVMSQQRYSLPRTSSSASDVPQQFSHQQSSAPTQLPPTQFNPRYHYQ